jgi:TPR repeat protein
VFRSFQGIVAALTTLALLVGHASADDQVISESRPAFTEPIASHSQLSADRDSSGLRKEYADKGKAAEQALDYNAAISWFQKAAELGEAESMSELGWIYFGAHDIPGAHLKDRDIPPRHFKDYTKAAFWFQKAADLNYAPAISQLAVMYNADGSLGLPEDHAKAAQLFLKAAAMGDAEAMDNLGVMYMRGTGVPRDIGEAVHWWRKAAALGGISGQAAQSWLDIYDRK